MRTDINLARDEDGRECKCCLWDEDSCRCAADCGSIRCLGWADRVAPLDGER